MLTYLEDGYGVYLIIAICGIGMIAKLIANIIYSALVKQSENMVSAKDKCLKQLRLKFENTYKMNMDVKNVQIFVEKNLNKYHFCGLSLKKWDNLNRQNAVLCLLLGLLFTFYSYWSQGSTNIVLLQMATGVILCVLSIFFETIADTANKQDILLVNLRDYFENTLSYKAAFEASESLKEANERVDNDVSAFMKPKNTASGLNIIRNSKMRERDRADAKMKENASQSVKPQVSKTIISSKNANKKSEKNNNLNYKSSGENESLNYKFKKPENEQEKNQISPDYATEIEALKKSLAQIAAAREDRLKVDTSRGGSGKRADLSPDEEKIIEDIIKEYLV